MSNNQTNLLVIEVNCLKHYKQPLYGWHRIVQVVIPLSLSLIWFPIVVLNFIALLVYLKKPMRMRVSNLFILNTILADLLTGLFTLPADMIYNILITYFHRVECLVFKMRYFGFIFIVVSFVMVTLAAVDRYVAIFTPFLYSTRICHWTKFYYFIAVLTWIISISLVTLAFLVETFRPTLYFISIQLLINFYVNFRLCNTIRNLQKSMNKQQAVRHSGNSYDNLNHQGSGGGGGGGVDRNISKSKNVLSSKSRSKRFLWNQQRIHKECKSNRIIFLILISLCVCYTPYFGTSVVWDKGYEREEVYTINSIGIFMFFFKSFLNPLIYMYSMPTVKKKMKELLSSCCRRNRVGTLSVRSENIKMF